MLSIRTGIAPQAWREGDERDLLTALELLRDEDEKARRQRGRERP